MGWGESEAGGNIEEIEEGGEGEGDIATKDLVLTEDGKGEFQEGALRVLLGYGAQELTVSGDGARQEIDEAVVFVPQDEGNGHIDDTGNILPELSQSGQQAMGEDHEAIHQEEEEAKDKLLRSLDDGMGGSENASRTFPERNWRRAQ